MLAYLDQQQKHVNSDPNPSTSDTSPAVLDANFSVANDSSPAATDFGGLVTATPLAFIRPSTADDVAQAVRLAGATHGLTLSARGNGHSVSGQAMAQAGLVLDMRALAPSMELVTIANGGSVKYSVDVSAGALWEEVLEWGVKNHGLAPASWTDYLSLTVGGTLSVGGVSGQAFRHGPQLSNVDELEVITGNGDRRVCSPVSQPDLFYGCLGGLGQFGIITRARIRLIPVHKMVRWIRVMYTEFAEYTADAESLIKCREPGMFDYVEGFAFVNDVDDPVNGWGSVPVPTGPAFDLSRVPSGSGRILYCLELALYYDDLNSDRVSERVGALLEPLQYIRGLEFATDVGYVEFLTRVKRVEEEARANGIWQRAHPWLNIFVASKDITDFDKCVFKDLLKDGIGGPMLVYPLLASKWDRKMSVAVPKSEVFYLVALLRFSSPSEVNRTVTQNLNILELCKSKGYDFKVYIPQYKTENDWATHFGQDWHRFIDRKNRYDPLALFAPGQRIFSRVC